MNVRSGCLISYSYIRSPTTLLLQKNNQTNFRITSHKFCKIPTSSPNIMRPALISIDLARSGPYDDRSSIEAVHFPIKSHGDKIAKCQVVDRAYHVQLNSVLICF